MPALKVLKIITLQHHNSPANCGREVLKHSKDAASLLGCIFFNWKVLDCVFFCGWRPKWDRF